MRPTFELPGSDCLPLTLKLRRAEFTQTRGLPRIFVSDPGGRKVPSV